MGPNMSCLLVYHWGNQQIIPNAGRLIWKAFGIGKGVTQGEPASPIIFNIFVDAVARAVLAEVCGPREAQHGLG